MGIIGNRDPDLPGDQHTQFGAEQGAPDAGRSNAPERPLPVMTDPGPLPAPAAASRRRRWRPLGFLAVCLLVLLLVAGWLYVFAPVSAPPGVTLADLHGVGDLQARFNADRGQPRLIVIFSPT
jgi:hypothetical protein